jgi:hypothetical protein
MARSQYFLLMAAALAAATPARAATIAQDVADVSTSACLKVASGELTLSSPATAAYEAEVAKLGLSAGLERAALDMLGPGSALVSRTAMATRQNGSAYIILAANGPMPGCRVILAAEPDAAAMDAVAAALIAPDHGWKAVPGMTEMRGIATKRVFLRRDAAGKPYMLNLVGLKGVPGKVQLYTTTVAVPPGVAIPPGF